MTTKTGTVEHVNERTFGTKTFYSCALEGESGWFNLPKGAPLPAWFGKGAKIQFQFEVNAKGYNDMTVGTLEQVAGAATSGGSAPRYVANGGADSRQVSIVSQVAFKGAVESVLHGITGGTIKVPAKANVIDVLGDHVELLTARYLTTLFEYEGMSPADVIEYVGMKYGFGNPDDQDSGLPPVDAMHEATGTDGIQ